MEELLQNDLFHLVFGILAAIFLLSALVNAIRSRIRNNRRETARMIKNNGNTGNNNNASNVNGVVPGFSILQVTMHKGEIIITMIREGEYNLPYARLAFGKYCGFSFRKSLL